MLLHVVDLTGNLRNFRPKPVKMSVSQITGWMTDDTGLKMNAEGYVNNQRFYFGKIGKRATLEFA